MSIVFAASEVGSVRALLPVCEFCSQRGLSVSVFNIGYMAEVPEHEWHRIERSSGQIDELCNILVRNNTELLIFSVNVKDTLPLQIARAAQKLDIPTIHVLDYWNLYLDRMQLDNRDLFKPTVYVVPDEYARQKAIQEGVHNETVQVTGQPAFADIIEQYDKIANVNCAEGLTSFDLNQEKKLVIFVSEPVSEDQGNTLEDNSRYRGYTEKETLKIFIDALSHTKHNYQVCILPHPREDSKQVEKYWHEIGGGKWGKVVSDIRGRDLLPYTTAVVGMSSTLLYEAWLLGLPILSIQPGLRNDSLRMIGDRDGVTLIDKKERADEMVLTWLDRCNSLKRKPCRDEIELHRNAVENIYQLIRNFTH